MRVTRLKFEEKYVIKPFLTTTIVVEREEEREITTLVKHDFGFPVCMSRSLLLTDIAGSIKSFNL